MERPDNETIVRMWAEFGPSETARRTGLTKQRVDQLAHRQKNLARRAVTKALLSGRLVRPNRCESCGRRCFPEAHHDDYSQRLAVRWLCRERGCHKTGRDKDWRPGFSLEILSVSGATREAARDVLRAIGYGVHRLSGCSLPFSKREPRYCKGYCGRRAKRGGFCLACCYTRDPEYHAYRDGLNASWQKRHRDQYRRIQKAAAKRWQKKLRERAASGEARASAILARHRAKRVANDKRRYHNDPVYRAKRRAYYRERYRRKREAVS